MYNSESGSKRYNFHVVLADTFSWRASSLLPLWTAPLKGKGHTSFTLCFSTASQNWPVLHKAASSMNWAKKMGKVCYCSLYRSVLNTLLLSFDAGLCVFQVWNSTSVAKVPCNVLRILWGVILVHTADDHHSSHSPELRFWPFTAPAAPCSHMNPALQDHSFSFFYLYCLLVSSPPCFPCATLKPDVGLMQRHNLKSHQGDVFHWKTPGTK